MGRDPGVLARVGVPARRGHGVRARPIRRADIHSVPVAPRRRLDLRTHARNSARRRCQVERARTVPAATDARLADACASGLLVLGVAIGVFIWLRGLRGVPFIPPGSDAARHGWMVARILYGQTTAPSEVLTYDAGGAHQAFHYYPTALHASAALSTRIVGGDVAHVLVAYLVLFSAVVLPVGMFVLARTLSPTQPLVAGFTALVVPLLVVFPYSPVWYGDIPQIVAMALVPVAVVLLLRPMLARRPPTLLNAPFVVALIPSALAIVCITAVHSSELPVVVFLALLLVLERAWRKRNPRMLPPALLRGAAAGLLAVALFAPTLVAFAGGVSERTSVRARSPPRTRGIGRSPSAGSSSFTTAPKAPFGRDFSPCSRSPASPCACCGGDPRGWRDGPVSCSLRCSRAPRPTA